MLAQTQIAGLPRGNHVREVGKVHGGFIRIDPQNGGDDPRVQKLDDDAVLEPTFR